MGNARAARPYLRSYGKKHDVLYVNTPWDKLDLDKIAKLPVKNITADNSAVFMWVDSFSAPGAVKLIEKWGLEFHSVVQVADFANYQWMKKPKAEQQPKVEALPPQTEPVDLPTYEVSNMKVFSTDASSASEEDEEVEK